jgi:predicted ATPase
MPQLPTGTVTFLFTDIEGSTRLLDELGDGYAQVLADHHRLMREAIAANGGVEVDTQGDAFFVAFRRASDAVSAAYTAQESLGQAGLRVRMGIHTGEPLLTETGYVGMDVHRAARVMSAGHGGQVVVSELTRRLLDDLGEHRLKDLSAPQRLFQLGDGEFPPLKTLHHTNLPVQPTPLIGREEELRHASDLLREHRLVTLVGPGGSGKTRLALQLAADAVEEFAHGVYWVPLQAVADPALVLPAIAQAVGAQNGVADYLRGRRTLLLLDNLEQILEAAPAVADLLRDTEGVKVLATSREPLRVAGERRFPVDPLPDDDAQALFLERAGAVDPGFESSPAVAEICRRLDGLPLALELAAARVSLLAPEELLGRLEQALPLLTGGAREAPERQRTLRATIEWSYELLDEEEQRAFRTLSVFAGSFELESAQGVAGADLDTLQSLVDKSLIRRWGSGRFGMLETIHEYARERLEPEEADEIGRRHAEHYLELARSTNLSAESTGKEDRELGRLEAANFRTALAWSRDNDAELGLRIAVALEQLWVSLDPFEGGRWFDQLLAACGEVDPALRAAALRAHGGVVYIVGDFERGTAMYVESFELYRSIGDAWGEAHMLHRLALEHARRGEPDRARQLAEEALALSRRAGDPKGEAVALTTLATVAEAEGGGEEVLELYAESADLARKAGFTWWVGGTLLNMAETAEKLGRLDDADRWVREALPLLQEVGDRQYLVYALALGARIAGSTGRPGRAGLLWGSVEAEEQRGRVGQWETDRPEFADPVLSHEGPEFDRRRAEGRSLTLDEAVERAFADD